MASRSKCDGDELLAQVWESPADRDRLGVYADWLLEHGDRTRGEYMQLALLASATPAQDKRREALRKRHRGQWLGAARPFVSTWEDSEQSPGLVSRVSCSTKSLAAGFEPICALAPRLTVRVNPVKTAAERALLASIPLGRLYGLYLADSDGDWLDDRLVAMLAPTLGGLRRLELWVWSSKFTLAGWRMVLELTTLEELEVFYHGARDDYLDALLESPLARGLRSVTVPEPEDTALRRRLETTFAGRALQFTS